MASHENIAGRRATVAGLDRHGWSLREIAAHLGVSHETIRRDLAFLADTDTTQPDPDAPPAVQALDLKRLRANLPDPPAEDGPTNLTRFRETHDPDVTPPPTAPPVCPRCDVAHEPRPAPFSHWAEGSVLPDLSRPKPLGWMADETPLLLRHHRRWT